MTLLKMSISAGIMVIIITVIRAIAINQLPKRTFLTLWGIVLVRLLFPFSWPSSLSIYSLVNASVAKQIGSIPVEHTLQTISNLSIPIQPTKISPWGLIWVSGVALSIFYFTIAYIRCKRRFAASQPVKNTFVNQWLKEHKCKRTITICQIEGISAPLTYGIIHPVILMPAQTDWTDTRELKYVLTHEYVHIRRFDGITKLLLTVALCIHWFNPLVWAMYMLSNRDIELACDEKVIRIFGETVKSAYALALISMEEKKIGLTPLCNNFSKNAIEERIEAIMKIKKTSITAVVVALCLVGGITVTFATSASANAGNRLDIETGIAMAGKTSDGSSYQYSDDEGVTWISETDYNAMYPQDEIVYWTYDEYKNWLEEYSSRIQSYVGSGAKYKDPDGNWVEWTQERVDSVIKRENEILDSIKNGAKISKTINGNDNIVTMGNPPTSDNIGISYGGAVTDEDGEIFDLGTFSSEEDRLAAVRQYCEQQVKAGKMSQNEADIFIKTYRK